MGKSAIESISSKCISIIQKRKLQVDNSQFVSNLIIRLIILYHLFILSNSLSLII